MSEGYLPIGGCFEVNQFLGSMLASIREIFHWYVCVYVHVLVCIHESAQSHILSLYIRLCSNQNSDETII